MLDFSKTVGYQSLFGTLYAGTIRDLEIEESYQCGGYDFGSISKSDILSGTTDTNAEIRIKEYNGFTFNKEFVSIGVKAIAY